MNIYAMADLHLSLGSDKPMDIFGERWNDHTRKMQENWIRTVGPEDVVIISGDISWGLKLEEAMADLEWIHRLPGRKILSRGNHDLWWNSLKKLNTLFDDMVFLQNNCFVLGNTAVCATRGWTLPQAASEWTEHDEKIFRREQLRLEMALQAARQTGCERIIVSMHYPPLNQREKDTDFTALIEKYGTDIVLYGHLHGEEAGRGAYRGTHNGIMYHLVASDQIGFCPKFICAEKGGE